jgi:uncharacterized Zn finger protein
MMGGMDISTALTAKANRLVEAGRVTHVKGLLYRVEGDTDTYTVHLSFPEEASGACNCQATLKVCSHILAAAISYLADPPLRLVPDRDPFEGLN